MQVFDLGAEGDEPVKKVAEVTDFYQVRHTVAGAQWEGEGDRGLASCG